LIVVDDRLLFAVRAEMQEPAVARFIDAADRGEAFTTGTWYWRLARALAGPGGGSLSRPVDALSDAESIRVRLALETLPPSIGLITLRRLVPVMAALPGELNLLTAEAVAAAVVLDAPIAVTSDSDLLDRTAAQVGVDVEKVAFGI
jgi:hypothetical protein